MRRKKIGVMDIQRSVDITDPCYDRDVWCRMDGVPIKSGTGSLMKSMMNCTFPISWASSGYISMASFLHRNPWRESEASASMRGWRVSSTTSLTLLMRNGLPSVNKSERETPGLPILVFSVRPVMAMVGMMCLPPKPTAKTLLWKSGLFKAGRCIHGLPKLYFRPYQEG